MDIITCKFCHKRFKGYSALCLDCSDQLDKKYIIVRNYLDRHSESNLKTVAEEAEVDEKSLLFLIREGRLTLSGDSSGVACLKCGNSIDSGRYCEKCKADLVRTLASTRDSMAMASQAVKPKAKAAEESKSKMHILKNQ